MEHQHYRTANNENDVDDEEIAVNNKNILQKSTDDDIEEGLTKKNITKKKFSFAFLDNHELSVTPIPESINDEDENIDTIESTKSQVKIKLRRKRKRTISI
jgi:hypothetical protein